MSIFVVSSCFLENLNSKIYLTEVLLKFTQMNSLRVGIDTEKKLIDIYSQIAENKPEVASWLALMSYEPTSFEEIIKIDPSISDKTEMFLFVCKSIVDNNSMIVNSIQRFHNFETLGNKKIKYMDKIISILERDDAVEEFRAKYNTVNIHNSIVANDGSSIEGVNK